MTDSATQATSEDAAKAAASSPEATRQRIEALPFDRALAELQSVVAKLEQGNLQLEESIALFEVGVLLQRHCERLIGEAEVRFQRLVESAGGQLRALDLSLGESEET